MGAIEKQVELMRNNPRDWRIEALIAIAHRYGNEVRNPRWQPLHLLFSRERIRAFSTIAPAYQAGVHKAISGTS